MDTEKHAAKGITDVLINESESCLLGYYYYNQELTTKIITEIGAKSDILIWNLFE